MPGRPDPSGRSPLTPSGPVRWDEPSALAAEGTGLEPALVRAAGEHGLLASPVGAERSYGDFLAALDAWACPGGCTARRRTAAPGGGRGVRGTRLVGVNTDQITSPDCEFAMAFSSTRRGARLARRLVAHRLDAWGHPYDSAVNETVTLLAAELSANAVSHGHVPGRDFHLRLMRAAGRVRVEVSDTRTERRPDPASAVLPDDDAESGRGLLLVAALSDAWGVDDRLPGPGKTVWAELATSHDAQLE